LGRGHTRHSPSPLFPLPSPLSEERTPARVSSLSPFFFSSFSPNSRGVARIQRAHQRQQKSVRAGVSSRLSSSSSIRLFGGARKTEMISSRIFFFVEDRFGMPMTNRRRRQASGRQGFCISLFPPYGFCAQALSEEL